MEQHLYDRLKQEIMDGNRKSSVAIREGFLEGVATVKRLEGRGVNQFNRGAILNKDTEV